MTSRSHRMGVSAAAVLSMACACLAAPSAYADLYHYRNLLLGERAAGMGGAYNAVSDDPTGVFYNPAGLVWGFENYISVSANSYSIVQTKYEDIVGGQDYTLRSQGLIPAFFGFSQTFGRDKFAFAIMVPEQELLDQDDNLTTTNTAPLSTRNLQRRFFKQDTTYLFGPALARAYSKSFSAGVTLAGFFRLAHAIDNQLVLFNPDAGGISRYYYQNTYLRQSAYGFAPKLGVQYMPTSQVSLGFTVEKKIEMGSTGSARVLNSDTDASNKPDAPTGEFADDHDVRELRVNASIPCPLTTSLGAAWFPSKSLLFSLELDYYLRDPDFRDFQTVNTWNFAVGTEIYPTETLAVRGGIFSNHANTPGLTQGLSDQALNVDLYGASMGVSFIKSGSSFTLGAVYSYGRGEGQVIGGVSNIQKASMNSLVVSLSGSYQL